MCGEHLAKANKGAHNENVHLHGAFAVEYRRKHCNAVLGKYIRRCLATSAAFLCSCNLQEQRVIFLLGQLEHEILWEARSVAADGEIQVTGGHAIEFCQADRKSTRLNS